MLRKPVWRHIRRQSPKKATIKELRGEIKELEGDIKELQEEKVYQSEAGSCLVSNNRDSSDAAVWLLWGGRGWSLHSTTQFLCGGWGSRSWISGAGVLRGPTLSRLYADVTRIDRKSTRLNSSHSDLSRMPSSA